MASSPQQFPSGFYDRCRNVAHIGITPSQPCNVRGFVLHEGFDGNPAPFAKGEYMFTPAIHETAALCGVSGVRSCLRFPCQLAQMLRLHSGLQETGRVMAHFGLAAVPQVSHAASALHVITGTGCRSTKPSTTSVARTSHQWAPSRSLSSSSFSSSQACVAHTSMAATGLSWTRTATSTMRLPSANSTTRRSPGGTTPNDRSESHFGQRNTSGSDGSCVGC